jgi:hypothetical protein
MKRTSKMRSDVVGVDANAITQRQRTANERYLPQTREILVGTRHVRCV